MTSTALVYGLAISGEAVARALHDRGVRVLVADDAPNDSKAAVAASFGAELVAKPDAATIDTLVSSVDIVCPAPGVPETHAVIDAAIRLGRSIRSEIDLAYEWEQQRLGGPRPMLAVTGTDGKTTTTMMAAAMLRCAGLKVAAVGNTEVPLIAALDTDVDAFVVECSSFRLNWIDNFRSEASVWLNLAEDHQNWHVSMPAYEQSKARMWRHNRPTDVAVDKVEGQMELYSSTGRLEDTITKEVGNVDSGAKTFVDLKYSIIGSQSVKPRFWVLYNGGKEKPIQFEIDGPSWNF
jgi:UDP-N-acetylmuramoylalanine--D-glutamate ligase